MINIANFLWLDFKFYVSDTYIFFEIDLHKI